jgi:hypothetical protein
MLTKPPLSTLSQCKMKTCMKLPNLDHSTEGQNVSALEKLRGGNGGTDRGLAIAQLTSLPEELEMVIRDKVWLLSTELAEPEGGFCDKIRCAVVALLNNGRRCQGRSQNCSLCCCETIVIKILHSIAVWTLCSEQQSLANIYGTVVSSGLG